MTDSTPDLAAIRARHHSWTDRSGCLVCAGAHHDYPCDVAVLLAVVDAQAARLAAVEQRELALAEGVVELGKELALPAEMAWLWKLAVATLETADGR